MARTFGSGTFGSGLFGEGGEESSVTSPVAVKHETIPDKLACRIDPPGGGQPARWSEDEAAVANVMDSVTLSDEMPGGYKQANATLARDPRLIWPDLEGFGDMTFYIPGAEEVWNGRLEKSPDETGDNIVINPEGTGWQAALEDNKAAQIGIIDSDITKWGDISAQRRLNLIEGGISPDFFSSVVGFQDAGEALAALTFFIQELVNTTTEHGELSYYGDGVDIGTIRYNFRGHGEDANWTDRLDLCGNDLTALDEGTNYHANINQQNKNVTAGGAGRKYARIIIEYIEASFSATGLTLQHRWEVPRVIGNHGIPAEGTWPDIGYVAKKCIEYIIRNFVESLVVDPSLIENDGFVIPQAWYGSPAASAEAIKDVTKYSLWDWFVYSARKFQYRKPGSYGRFWKLYVSESNIQDTGMDTSRLWSSIVVQYTEQGGQQRTVGPIGSGCNTESEALEIKDPENPAFKAVKNRRDLIVMQISTPAGAIEVGKRFLEEANLLPRSGSARISGYALDNKSVLRPVSQMHSGDYVSFVDHGTDVSYRKIVNKSYAHDSREATIDFDAPPGGLEQLLERLQVVLIRAGVS